MALQMGAVLAASRVADVPDDLAQRAAEELAGYENRFHSLEGTMSDGFTGVDRRFNEYDRRLSAFETKTCAHSAKLEGDNTLLRWMITFNLGLTVLLLSKVFGVIHS